MDVLGEKAKIMLDENWQQPSTCLYARESSQLGPRCIRAARRVVCRTPLGQEAQPSHELMLRQASFRLTLAEQLPAKKSADRSHGLHPTEHHSDHLVTLADLFNVLPDIARQGMY